MGLLYLDRNYLSGTVKRKVGFRELEPALRAAVARGAVAVPESEVLRLESAARPDLPLLELLRELSAGLTLPHRRGAVERYCERRLEAILERDFPARRSRPSDRLDVRARAVALPRWRLVTCDAFMADVVRRTGLDGASAASSSPVAARTSSDFEAARVPLLARPDVVLGAASRSLSSASTPTRQQRGVIDVPRARGAAGVDAGRGRRGRRAGDEERGARGENEQANAHR